MKARAVAVLASAAAAALAALIACGKGTHAYTARPYDPARNCLAQTTAVDAVDGTDPGLNCARKCALSPKPDDGGPSVAYISTACPPYPPGFDMSGLVGACPAAIAAADREDYCLDDGGSTHPAPPDAAAAGDAMQSGDAL